MKNKFLYEVIFFNKNRHGSKSMFLISDFEIKEFEIKAGIDGRNNLSFINFDNRVFDLTSLTFYRSYRINLDNPSGETNLYEIGFSRRFEHNCRVLYLADHEIDTDEFFHDRFNMAANGEITIAKSELRLTIQNVFPDLYEIHTKRLLTGLVR